MKKIILLVMLGLVSFGNAGDCSDKGIKIEKSQIKKILFVDEE